MLIFSLPLNPFLEYYKSSLTVKTKVSIKKRGEALYLPLLINLFLNSFTFSAGSLLCLGKHILVKDNLVKGYHASLDRF